MMRILNDEHVWYSKGKKLDSDLELLLNRIGSVFKPNEEEPPEVDTLQAALTAQVRKNNYKHRGAPAKDRDGPGRPQAESKFKAIPYQV